MEPDFDWNDLRFFLEVQRAGRLNRAARRLGVSHTTVARHISRLEAALGKLLFEPAQEGLRLTEAGAALMPVAEVMETNAIEAMNRFQSKGALTGRVRVGAPDGYGNAVLSKWLPEICRVEPQLEIELVPMPKVHKLWNRDVDIAIGLDRPESGHVVMRKLIDYDLRLYAARGFFKQSAAPRSREELAGLPAVGYIDELLFTPELDFNRLVHPDLRVIYRSATVQGQVSAVTAAAGIGVLPCFMAQDCPLVPILPEEIGFRRAYWLLYREDSRNQTGVRRVADFIYAATRRNAALFAFDASRCVTS